jgi:hypothetical protein
MLSGRAVHLSKSGRLPLDWKTRRCPGCSETRGDKMVGVPGMVTSQNENPEDYK